MAKSVKKSAPAPKAPAKPRKPAAKKTTPSNGPEIQISEEQIAQLAHRFFLERGCEHGHDEEDWRRAEQELRKRSS